MSLLRVTRVATPAFARSFSVSAARTDLIKDLYIKELKSYKPAAQSDVGKDSIRTFTAPAAPKAPELPSDLAAELSKFDATEPTLGNTAAPAAGEEAAGQSAQEYLKFLEADLPKEAHH